MPGPRGSPFLDGTLFTLWCSPGGSATVGFLNLGHPCSMLQVGRGCSLHPGVLFSVGAGQATCMERRSCVVGPWTLLICRTCDLKTPEKAAFQVVGYPPGQRVLP